MKVINAIALVLIAVTALAQESPPLPLDPLTAAERETALKLAQSSARVRELLGNDYRLVTAYSMGVKRTPNETEPRGRHAIVLYIRNDNQAGVQALVDLTAGAVVDAVRIPPLSVPLGIADVELAFRIFSETQQGRALLGERLATFHTLTGPVTRENANDNLVEGLQTIGGGPEDICRRHRCVALLFESGGRLLFTDRTVLIDLNDRRAIVTTVKPPTEVH